MWKLLLILGLVPSEADCWVAITIITATAVTVATAVTAMEVMVVTGFPMVALEVLMDSEVSQATDMDMDLVILSSANQPAAPASDIWLAQELQICN